MSTCLVTGAAGFIGSHLCEQLLAKEHKVHGIDAFIPYYSRKTKESNLICLQKLQNFTFHELDLRYVELTQLLKDIDVIFHLAGMPGLIQSWSDFNMYLTCNMTATQRLLEAAHACNIQHFIYGSTSSVYGQHAVGREDGALLPFSPYGVTKLGAEQLCTAYAENFGLPLTILRLFSVYGQRQRPDMAYHIFIRALLNNEPITIYGNGNQSRSNTFITDCIEGILLAFEKPEQSIGEIFNIGGGEVITLNRALEILTTLTGTVPHITFAPPRPGDQYSTAADISKIQRLLGYQPKTPVSTGLQAQVEWQRGQLQRLQNILEQRQEDDRGTMKNGM